MNNQQAAPSGGDFTLWTLPNQSRHFLIPDKETIPAGSLLIKTLTGQEALVEPSGIEPFEIPESQAREWAKGQLGEALGEIRGSIDGKLSEWRERLDEFNRTPVTEDTTLTPNAAPALLSLFKQLPGIIANSLHGEGQRLGEARDAMAALQRKLKESGIDLDDRFTAFPDRLAELRKEFGQEPDTPSAKGKPASKKALGDSDSS
jgi:hypothetical protein